MKTQKRQRRDAAKSRWLKEKNAGASIPASIPQCSASASASASAKHNPPTPLAGGDGFGRFWEAYPKKVGKGEALKSWKKIRPSGELVAKILGAVHVQRGSEQWRKESGQFIPNPATWLNQTRWEDELDTARPQAPKIMGNCPACQGAIREGDEVERSKSGRDYHSNCLKVIRERAEIEKNRGANV
ncbi:MAG: hypothetical protein Q8P12_02060 [bacterium]|nr:hypothetical protein [bacterium]